ncbi:unnamed protein product [Polarella glacialis]|uniref:Uncharacterized protein n=1 Tax=Polarella glacialis TaxID=89957 RepID=A0A813KZD9_POLGL|nr:unnamed protein product [Polarella glacialis]
MPSKLLHRFGSSNGKTCAPNVSLTQLGRHQVLEAAAQDGSPHTDAVRAADLNLHRGARPGCETAPPIDPVDRPRRAVADCLVRADAACRFRVSDVAFSSQWTRA